MIKIYEAPLSSCIFCICSILNKGMNIYNTVRGNYFHHHQVIKGLFFKNKEKKRISSNQLIYDYLKTED